MPSYLDYDYDYDDRPTRAECEADEFQDRVREAHLEGLRTCDPWYRKAWFNDLGPDCLTPEVMATYGTFLQKLVASIHAKMRDMEEDEDAINNTAYEMADEEAYRRDPYAYYGVRRSDF
jgi:hypothetical protein